MKSLTSIRNEVLLVLGVILALLLLPVAALTLLIEGGSSIDSNTMFYTGPASNTNTYIYGFCTFWTAKRREEVGIPIPNSWGDANEWDRGASKDGYIVDHKPTLHAIMHTDVGRLGHVAFVESIELDGGWKVSEMNAQGWDVISTRAFRAADAEAYNFIH